MNRAQLLDEMDDSKAAIKDYSACKRAASAALAKASSRSRRGGGAANRRGAATAEGDAVMPILVAKSTLALALNNRALAK